MRTTPVASPAAGGGTPVVRVIDVPATTTLPELHLLLEAALGWQDTHLHQFEAGDVRYGPPDPDGWGSNWTRPASG